MKSYHTFRPSEIISTIISKLQRHISIPGCADARQTFYKFSEEHARKTKKRRGKQQAGGLSRYKEAKEVVTMGRIVDEHCVPKYNDKLAIPAFVVIPSRTIHYPSPLKLHCRIQALSVVYISFSP